jgi:hypothetical protein
VGGAVGAPAAEPAGGLENYQMLLEALLNELRPAPPLRFGLMQISEA